MRLAMLGLVLAMGAGGAWAQAPAGAPAGANGICKDGTYSMQAKKEGACRGHKGVQTWYTASTAGAPAAMPAATPGGAMASQPAPTRQSAAPAAMPAPTPSAPATASVPAAASAPATGASKRMSPEAAAAAKTAAPGGGPGLVWVNTSSNVYHCNGDVFYGKTKAGKYMTEDAAKAAGAHGDRGKSCAGK